MTQEESRHHSGKCRVLIYVISERRKFQRHGSGQADSYLDYLLDFDDLLDFDSRVNVDCGDSVVTHTVDSTHCKPLPCSCPTAGTWCARGTCSGCIEIGEGANSTRLTRCYRAYGPRELACVWRG